MNETPHHQKRTLPILITALELKDRVAALAAEIARDMPPNFLMVSLLRGSFMFAADLARELYHVGAHPQMDFITLGSYGAGTQSTGEVQMLRDISDDVLGREVLILDDILETGRTLSFAKTLLQKRGAAKVKIAVLLEKPGKLAVEMKADFVGFSIPDKFVVGYGLDYANHYRELPFVGYLDVH